jgi:hypothetical protein
LLELGAVALPDIAEAFRATNSFDVKLRLAQVVAHSRVPEAMPLLVELLEHPAPEIWKTALDGLVMLGTDNSAARKSVLELLAAARCASTSTKTEWIAEAIEQLPSLDARRA